LNREDLDPGQVYDKVFIKTILRGIQACAEDPHLNPTLGFRTSALRVLGSPCVWKKRVVDHGVVVGFLVDEEFFEVPLPELQMWLWELQTDADFNVAPTILDLLLNFTRPGGLDVTEEVFIRTLRLYLYAHHDGLVNSEPGNNNAIHVSCGPHVPMSILICLMESGIDINTKNIQHLTPLMLLGQKHDRLSITKMRHILLNGASVEALDLNMNTALHAAAAYNNPVGLSLMLLALDYEQEVNALTWQNCFYELPLNLLVKGWTTSTDQDLGGPQGSVIMRMIEAGADPNHQKLLDDTVIATMQDSWSVTDHGIYASFDFRLVSGLVSIGIRAKARDVVASIDMVASKLPYYYYHSSKLGKLLSKLVDSPFKFTAQRPDDAAAAPTIIIDFFTSSGKFTTTVIDNPKTDQVHRFYRMVIKLPLDKCDMTSIHAPVVDKRYTTAHEIMGKTSTNATAAAALLPVMRAHCCPFMLSVDMLSPADLAKKILQAKPNFTRAFMKTCEPFKVLHADYLKMRKSIIKSMRSRFKFLSDDAIEKILNHVSPKLTNTFLIEAGYIMLKCAV
jgi:hypothetical protein